MKWPQKSLFGALAIGALLGFPDSTAMLKLSGFIMLCMTATVLPLLILSKRISLCPFDHWMGPYFESPEASPGFKNLIYGIGPLLCISLSALAIHPSSFFYPYSLLPIIWGCVRLFPAHPFEGWHILRGLLRPILGFWERSISYLVSGVFFSILTLLIFVYFPLPIYWISLVTISLSFQAWQHFSQLHRGGPADEDPKLLALYQEAVEFLHQNKNKQAHHCLENLIQTPLEGAIVDRARVLYAKELVEQAKPQEALDILRPCLKHSPKGVFIVLHRIAYQLDQWDMVRDLSQKAWNEKNESAVAIINAIASAKLYEKQNKKRLLEEVVGWLSAAAKKGYFPWDVLDSSDFDSVKNETLFKNLKKQIHSAKDR